MKITLINKSMTTEEKFKWLLKCKHCVIRFNPGYGQSVSSDPRYVLNLHPGVSSEKIAEAIEVAYTTINEHLYYKLRKLALKSKYKGL
jgi:ATP/maltotriose-dependent transcriptional regulator MalT